MDGASASDRYLIILATLMLRCVGGRVSCDKVFGVGQNETAFSADLGGSSKYSNKNIEGRSGEGFHVNSN